MADIFAAGGDVVAVSDVGSNNIEATRKLWVLRMAL